MSTEVIIDVMDTSIQLKDDGIFSQFIAAMRPTVKHIALHIIGNPADAEDATQEACIRALDARFDYRGESAPRYWICAIARHASIDFTRRQRTHRKNVSKSLEEIPSIDRLRIHT